MENNPEQAKEKGISKKTIKDYTKMSSKKWKKLKDRIKK